MTFSSIVGQAEIKERLGHALTGNPGHAYIFSGPQGIGRTHIARVFAAALLCHESDQEGACGRCLSCQYLEQQVHPDYLELRLQDKEKVIPVESVRRKISSDLYLQPQISQRKVYLIAADGLNEQGQNALLKSLEEPPSYAVFLLTVTSLDRLLPTVVSRAVHIRIHPCSYQETMEILKKRGLDQLKTAPFCARFSGGVPGAAIELAENEWFHELRKETIHLFSQLTHESRAYLLTKGYAMLDSNRRFMPEILKIMSSLIHDLMILSGGSKTQNLINEDQIGFLKPIAAGLEKTGHWQEHLGKAYRAIITASHGLEQNASFEGLACHLMLALRKELQHA